MWAFKLAKERARRRRRKKKKKAKGPGCAEEVSKTPFELLKVGLADFKLEESSHLDDLDFFKAKEVAARRNWALKRAREREAEQN